jgi:hypothetical protein
MFVCSVKFFLVVKLFIQTNLFYYTGGSSVFIDKRDSLFQ